MPAPTAPKRKKKKKSVLLRPTLSLIDKSIQKGILHQNTADRYKSRLTLRYNALLASSRSSST